MQRSNIKVLAIGVGHGIKYSELKMITGHSSSYVFPVQYYSGLNRILDQLIQKSCPRKCRISFSIVSVYVKDTTELLIVDFLTIKIIST